MATVELDPRRSRRLRLLWYWPVLLVLAVPLLVLTRGNILAVAGIPPVKYVLLTMVLPLFVTYPVLFFLLPWLAERRSDPGMAESAREVVNFPASVYFGLAALGFGLAFVGPTLLAGLFALAISVMFAVLFESLRIDLLRRRGRIR
jgi:hypothetical protein